MKVVTLVSEFPFINWCSTTHNISSTCSGNWYTCHDI